MPSHIIHEKKHNIFSNLLYMHFFGLNPAEHSIQVPSTWLQDEFTQFTQ